MTSKICRHSLTFIFFYHGLGGFVSSFHDSGTIIRRVTEIVPPDEEGVMVLKNTSRRSLRRYCANDIRHHLYNSVTRKNHRNVGALPSCVLNIFAVTQSSAKGLWGVNEVEGVEVSDLPSIVACGVATKLTLRCICSTLGLQSCKYNQEYVYCEENYTCYEN